MKFLPNIVLHSVQHSCATRKNLSHIRKLCSSHIHIFIMIYEDKAGYPNIRTKFITCYLKIYFELYNIKALQKEAPGFISNTGQSSSIETLHGYRLMAVPLCYGFCILPLLEICSIRRHLFRFKPYEPE